MLEGAHTNTEDFLAILELSKWTAVCLRQLRGPVPGVHKRMSESSRSLNHRELNFSRLGTAVQTFFV